MKKKLLFLFLIFQILTHSEVLASRELEIGEITVKNTTGDQVDVSPGNGYALCSNTTYYIDVPVSAFNIMTFTSAMYLVARLGNLTYATYTIAANTAFKDETIVTLTYSTNTSSVNLDISADITSNPTFVGNFTSENTKPFITTMDGGCSGGSTTPPVDPSLYKYLCNGNKIAIPAAGSNTINTATTSFYSVPVGKFAIACAINGSLEGTSSVAWCSRFVWWRSVNYGTPQKMTNEGLVCNNFNHVDQSYYSFVDDDYVFTGGTQTVSYIRTGNCSSLVFWVVKVQVV